MSTRLAAIEAARRALDVTEGVPYMNALEAVADVRKLRGVVEQLLTVVEGQPRPVRLAAEHDEQFLSLARAARTEIHAARGSLQRLDAFEQALTAMLWPEQAEGGEPQ
ncbi:hypothetical protein [Actinacidiphila oryziradicis]|uniref:Uncharacterized protein n=1 Tax=Actinacidiphila oryziradicis TaxID=2571141 RepID=A0A4U0SQV0_9ACTN|nr:hypothetical protein [Actinacidiphila oryziradicis]TKA11768.1 hypothetical protein FCI23_10590 [Actinacidiphila oryziradicis]